MLQFNDNFKEFSYQNRQKRIALHDTKALVPYSIPMHEIESINKTKAQASIDAP